MSSLAIFNDWRTVKVVGVNFVDDYPDNLLGLADDIDTYEPSGSGYLCRIELRRNPHNQYDSNAIEVRLSSTDEMLGHLPKELAKRIAPDMDEGVSWEAGIVSVDIHPDHRDRPGLTIEIRRLL